MDLIQNHKKVKVYTRLYQDLKTDILRGGIDYNVPLLGEFALSDKYGISRKSTRKALQILTDEGLLKRVSGHGTFVLPPSERKPKRPLDSLTVAIILPWIPQAETSSSEYDELLLEGLTAYAHRQQWQICLWSGSIDFATVEKKFKNNEIDGIIWDRPESERHTDIIGKLLKAEIPLLLINRSIGNAPCLLHDFHSELTDSVDFLASIGHQKISFLNFSDREIVYVERRKAFLKAMKKLGAESPESFYAETSFDEVSIHAEKLLEKSRATALIIGGLALLPRFMLWADKKGIVFPDDLSLLCLDDSNLSKTHRPPITVFAAPRFEMGKQAMYHMEMLIKGQVLPGEQFKIKGCLIARKSCAVPI